MINHIRASVSLDRFLTSARCQCDTVVGSSEWHNPEERTDSDHCRTTYFFGPWCHPDAPPKACGVVRLSSMNSAAGLSIGIGLDVLLEATQEFALELLTSE
ncbi:methyltransferase type 11 [Anopheles sinensis]|uniref:Methyltransferase type 11 n=1 Tax=Anopheles sinensis TaxID=74873 RepID=A0A084VL94_ANOSI|nr:methyltransferase type 11 [Anopheles sinensis]